MQTEIADKPNLAALSGCLHFISNAEAMSRSLFPMCGSRIRRIRLLELAIVKAKGVLNAEVFGYKLAGAVVPGGIAYAVAVEQKSETESNLRSGSFSSVSFSCT